MSSTAWAVYKTDKITAQTIFPMTETLVSIHETISAAMDEANRLKSADKNHSFLVGEA